MRILRVAMDATLLFFVFSLIIKNGYRKWFNFQVLKARFLKKNLILAERTLIQEIF